MPARSTIYEVARRSGVSTATVSRVMSQGTGFSLATKQKVLDNAKALGWTPSGTAKALAGQRVGIVGLLFPDLSGDVDIDPDSPLYVDQVIRGAERAATSAGDAVLIAATRSDRGRELAISVASKVDGLVVAAQSLSDKDVAALAKVLPVVVIATRPTRRRYDVVCADNLGGAAAVTEHLVLEHGYRDFAYVAGPARSPDSVARFAGHRWALEQVGHPVPDAPDAYGEFTAPGGARAMELILGRRRPRAVVFGNDEMAVGALSVLRRHRLRVPTDIAICGFDDISTARHLNPTLTTVRQPMRQIGEEAVRTLLARLRDPDAPRRELVLPTELVVRRSCGCTARRTSGNGAQQP